MYRFTFIRPDRAVVVRAATREQLVSRLACWTTLPEELLPGIAEQLWRDRVVLLLKYNHTLLRHEWEL